MVCDNNVRKKCVNWSLHRHAFLSNMCRLIVWLFFTMCLQASDPVRNRGVDDQQVRFICICAVAVSVAGVFKLPDRFQPKSM